MKSLIGILLMFLVPESIRASCAVSKTMWYNIYSFNNVTHNSILCIRETTESLNVKISNIYTKNHDTYKDDFGLQLQNINFSSLDTLNSTFKEKIQQLLVANNSLNVHLNTFAGLKYCKRITLIGGNVGDIVGFNNSGLVWLTVENSNVRNITNVCWYTPELKVLRLTENEIKTITKFTFVNCTKLNVLRLSNNHIETVEVDMFQGLESLRWLYLDQNRLSHIPPNAFRYCKNLWTLNIQGNQIKDIDSSAFSGLHVLETLYLNDNFFMNIKDNTFSNLSELKVLNLTNAGIENIESETFQGLIWLANLYISLNPIHNLPLGSFFGLSKITSLNLTKSNLNVLKKNQFAGLDHLRYFDISKSNIETLEKGTFNLIPILENINVSNNLLTRMPCDASSMTLQHLQYLDFSNNLIEIVENCTFSKYPFIKEIHIQNNIIESIQNGAFAFLIKLTVLNISNNKLKYLDDNLMNSWWQLRSLKFVELAGNPLDCENINLTILLFRQQGIEFTAQSINADSKYGVSCRNFINNQTDLNLNEIYNYDIHYTWFAIGGIIVLLVIISILLIYNNRTKNVLNQYINSFQIKEVLSTKYNNTTDQVENEYELPITIK